MNRLKKIRSLLTLIATLSVIANNFTATVYHVNATRDFYNNTRDQLTFNTKAIISEISNSNSTIILVKSFKYALGIENMPISSLAFHDHTSSSSQKTFSVEKSFDKLKILLLLEKCKS